MSEGKVTIKFERPLVDPVAAHVIALINEVLEPFAAEITEAELPVVDERQAS
jgi:hypothetical protein